MEKNWSWTGHVQTQARYQIRVPSEINTELSTGGGEIVATDLSGSCKAETSGGNLKFTRMRGPLRASTSGGQIEMEACDGALNVETSGGKIESLAGSGSLNASTSGGSIVVRNFSGDTKVETSGGALKLENIRGRLMGETSGGSISATVPAPMPGDIKLETCAGQIEIALPPDAGLDLNAETNEGCVTSELPMITKRAGREGLQGTINGGGKSLVLRTGAGNIAIKSTSPARNMKIFQHGSRSTSHPTQPTHERPPLRSAPTPQISRLHFARRNHARARHRDEHRDLQSGARSVSARSAV